MDEYLSIESVAKRLELTPKTVRNKMAKGDFKLGVHYFRPAGMETRFKWSAIVADEKPPTERSAPAMLLRGLLTDFKKPCVYIVSRHDEILYVGMSEYGVARPFISGHHVLKKMKDDPDVSIEVWGVATKEMARTEESRLIETLKPKFNCSHPSPSVRYWRTQFEHDGAVDAPLKSS
jgi:hypothetical protein